MIKVKILSLETGAWQLQGRLIEDPMEGPLPQQELSRWFWKDLHGQSAPEAWARAVVEHKLIQSFWGQISYEFQGPLRFLSCLSHKSFVNELPGLPWESYERLEFLGDSFLNYFITRELFRKLPGLSEGQYSKMRGALVNTEILSTFACALGIPSIVLLGRGHLSFNPVFFQKIYTDIFEAIIGGLVLEKGEDFAARLLKKWMEEIESQRSGPLWDLGLLETFDYKSRLQEVIMKRFRAIPEYRAKSIKGGNFLIRCVVKGKTLGELVHSSKRQGQKELAKEIFQNFLSHAD